MSVCACGAESPAMEPDALDAWEDDHTQWDCTAVEPRTWDEQLEQWTFPGLPAITRHDADITPEPVTPAPTRKDTTKHIWRPM